ncbi:accessory Sec system S-layer assembly protein [Bacillus sp. ISL-47]|uniref:accessory Sec system S-layer assembly protein n=1 Tax=Bacillus sp. ISL-47 TaxID=2819130 RepID=UPI001BE553E3|nr:accessory Sec system S-layer assembly protein [Bacillus sp. ISL-47]MBT2687189.1 accessory Sec system S-layer assembly protein [Bacillus sp. ISL-47]MBT2709789.1 accessory Sec system S-layer assembly protein [Pseudomonas sp. ISL-84]
MLSIFRKKNKEIKKSGKDNTIEAKELMDVKESADVKEVKTALFIHPGWTLPAEQQYVFRFLHNELMPLQPNQISIAGVDLANTPNGIEVTAFVRNSLQKKVSFGETTLLLLDEEQSLIARQSFDLSELGEIPAESSMPWVFRFPANTIKQEIIKDSNWTLAFELAKPHTLDLHESWEKALSAEEKEGLRKLVASAGKPKDGEVNFMGIKINHNPGENLSVTLMIRNGTKQDIHLHQIPLAAKDSSNEVFAQGVFKLEDFTVKANTSKPWTFIFPSSFIKKNDIDLTAWSIEVINN